MWYLHLTNPDGEMFTYELGTDAAAAAALVPAAKAHAGFPQNDPLGSPWNARLAQIMAPLPDDGAEIEGVVVPGTLVTDPLDLEAGEAYAAAEAAAAMAGATVQATIALAQLDGRHLRKLLLDMAQSLGENDDPEDQQPAGAST